MLKPTPASDNLLSPDQMAPALFKAGSFALQVKEVADRLFGDERWADMYADEGRPARSPRVMTVALILQQHRNLSDRQMEHATRFDLEIKAALDLPWDHLGIPKSNFGEFRKRLLKNGRECEAFNEFNRLLVAEGWVKQGEALIVDACHLEADASTPNPRLLIRKATRSILKGLEGERPDLYHELTKAITLRADTDFAGGRDYFLLPEAERQERFGKAVGEARTVIETLKGKKLSAALKAKLELLGVILEERSTDDDEPIDPEDAPKGRVASHRDPDARWGVKGKDKFFMGYKRTILTSKEHGFIANVDVAPGNTTDGSVLGALVDDTEECFGIKPVKLIGDAAYGSLDNHRAMNEKDVQLVTPIKPAPNPRGKFSRDRFTYDAEAQTLTCPAKQTTSEAFTAPDGEGLVYRFGAHQCGNCPMRSECTSGDFRSVKVAATIPEMNTVLSYGKTDDYMADMKARPVIEGKHSEIVRRHGGRRTRYVGLAKVFAGEVLRCLVVNLKRLFKLAAQQRAMAAA